MKEISKDLKQKRVSMLGIGTNKVKRFLNKQAKQIHDTNAYIIRFALEAVDSSMCIASNPHVDWHTRQRRNVAITLLSNPFNIAMFNNYNIILNEDENGKLYYKVNLPVTNDSISISESVDDEKRESDKEYHIKNFEAIERTIQELYGDKLSEQYADYRPVYVKEDSDCVLVCYRLF